MAASREAAQPAGPEFLCYGHRNSFHFVPLHIYIYIYNFGFRPCGPLEIMQVMSSIRCVRYADAKDTGRLRGVQEAKALEGLAGRKGIRRSKRSLQTR